MKATIAGAACVLAVGLAAGASPAAAGDVELQCSVSGGSVRLPPTSDLVLRPMEPWRLTFDEARQTLTLKAWSTLNVPRTTAPYNVSITADRIRFCALQEGCSNNGGEHGEYVVIDRRSRSLSWNYFKDVGKYTFEQVIQGSCDLYKEPERPPQAF